jgi:hypothetical protein
MAAMARMEMRERVERRHRELNRLHALRQQLDALDVATKNGQSKALILAKIATYALDWLEQERGLGGENSDFQE